MCIRVAIDLKLFHIIVQNESPITVAELAKAANAEEQLLSMFLTISCNICNKLEFTMLSVESSSHEGAHLGRLRLRSRHPYISGKSNIIKHDQALTPGWCQTLVRTKIKQAVRSC